MVNKTFGLLISLILISAGSCIQAQTPGENEITVNQVREKINAGEDIILLDVRTESEYTGALGHVDSSVLIPLDELDARINELENYKDKEIIVICRSGNRSGYATRILRDKDFKAFNMLGGMLEWNAQLKQRKEEE
jgi:rhodanese-related sulfurtransferase